ARGGRRRDGLGGWAGAGVGGCGGCTEAVQRRGRPACYTDRMLPIACDPDRLADEIAELAAHLDAATHRLLALIRRFDECAGWAEQGALSCAHWLSWRISLDLGAAREHVRVARGLPALPLGDGALRAGQESDSEVPA